MLIKVIKGELLKGRDLRTASCTPGRRSVSRDVSRLLSHRLLRLWECATGKNIGLLESASLSPLSPL